METQYVTSGQLKGTLSLTGTSYADADLDAVIQSASRAIDQLCNRPFFQTDDATQVRYYTPDSVWELEIDDLVALTTLQTDSDGNGTFEQTWTANTDFLLEPLNAAADTPPRPYTRICRHPYGSYSFPCWLPRSVKVTGMFGWPAVPDEIVTATTLLANRLLTVTRSAPLGIVAFDGGAIRVARMDSQVMMLVGSYMKHRIAVA